MNPYERLLKTMRTEGKKDNTAPIQIGVMTGADSCRIGKNILEREDLLIAEHLITGYHCAVSGADPPRKDEDTFVGPLKEGDQVAAYMISDECYIILGRLV